MPSPSQVFKAETMLDKDQKTASQKGTGENRPDVRVHHEKLVLTFLRRHGAHSKAKIAHHTNLSPQAVSVIIRELEKDGLLKKEKPVKGKVGQPSIPIALNPNGAFSLGLRVGRRSADLTLMDFLGRLREQKLVNYDYPTPSKIISFVLSEFTELLSTIDKQERERLIGLGIGKPFQLWNWLDRPKAPQIEMAEWKTFELKEELSKFIDCDIIVENDASCACLAEQIIGKGQKTKDFAYFFIGSFIGGGLVMNHKLFTGIGGNAGAFGSLPMGVEPTKNSPQLIDHASLYLLEQHMKDEGRNPSILWDGKHDWEEIGVPLSNWIDEASLALARATTGIEAVIDFPHVVIGGAVPETVLDEIVRRTADAYDGLNTQGITQPTFSTGTAGPNARALGASLLPISKSFLLETTEFDL